MQTEPPLTVAASSRFDPGSFRDRNGRVFYDAGGVYRCLSAPGLADWNALSTKRFFQRAVSQGQIVGTQQVANEAATDLIPAACGGDWSAVLQHERVPFVSHPYEWTFGMLQDAALLQLELLHAALDEDVVIKDSTPYNIQWKDGKPIFIDVLSFEKHTPGYPWADYRQFCQLFLYPLMLQAYKNVPFHGWLRGNVEGIDPEEFARLMSFVDWFRKGVFLHVVLHSKLQRAQADKQQDVRSELKHAGFHKSLIEANVSRLRRLVSGLRWKARESTWHDYSKSHSYSDRDLDRKKEFVREAVMDCNRRLVWDIGCNIGAFSRIAAEHAELVVAMDNDHLVMEHLYQSVKSDGLTRILPLVVNIADPPPNLGWRCLERRELAARGKPDLVLCLALLHHVAIGANIPVGEFIDWLAALEADLVIEFVTRDDPMVIRLLRNKTDNYADYQQEFLEICLSRSFDVVRREKLASGTRVLYFGKARAR